MSAGSNTTSTSNAPPANVSAAYDQVMARANNAANAPYTPYTGKLVADQSPATQQGYDIVGSTPGMTSPYLNTASADFASATAPLTTNMQPYVDQASGQFTKAAGTDLQGALSPYQSQAAQGFAAGSGAVAPTQYSASAIQGFESPYTNDVVNATQSQFNEQNAQAQNQLAGNAASKGALGGDRLGVAQGVLAGQQQMAQAPVLAGLRNTGFQQAQQEFNNQQGVNLGADQNNKARQLQGAQGIAGLGSQSLTAAQGQAGIEQSAGAGFANLGSQELGASQAQGWLSAQAGQGMAGLGNEALTNTLTEGNAMLGIGAQQQGQAQAQLNAPYEQYLAAQAFPYQQTGWLSNIAEGIGSNSGGIGATTSPAPSAVSQFGGLALGAGAIAGNNGAFKGLGSSLGFGGSSAAAAGSADALPIGTTTAETLANRGGSIRGFADGGEVDVVDASSNGIPTGSDALAGGSSLMKRDYGSSTHDDSPHDSVLGTILKTAGTIAATVYGGPAGGAAANVLNNSVHFNRGGFAHKPGGSVPILPRGFAAGGAPAISVVTVPDAHGHDVPTMMVDPRIQGHGVGTDAGSPSQQARDYFAQQQAGARPPPGTFGGPAPAPAPAAPAAPAPPSLSPDQLSQLLSLQQQQERQNDQSPSNGSMRRGGVLRGFADGGDTPDDDGPLPVPPIPPNQTAGSAGFARPPATVAAATATAPAGHDPAAPIPQFAGFDAVSKLGDVSKSVRDVPNSANPWLALAQAGFAMAAGRSPNALANIGEGAMVGMNRYMSDDRAAKELANKVDENRAKLKLSQAQDEQTGAYQQSEIASHSRGQDMSAQSSHEQMLSTAANERARLANSMAEAKMRIGEEHDYHSHDVDLRQQALDQGKYTWSAGMGPDPDDPTKTVAGTYRLPTKGGDEKPAFFPGQTLSAKGLATNATMPADVTEMLANRVLAGDTSALQALGQGTVGTQARIAVQTAVARKLGEQGLPASEITARATGLMADRAEGRTVGQRTGYVDMALTEAQSFVPMALAASEKVDRSQFPSLNRVYQAYEQHTGDESIIRLNIATNSLVNAYAKAVTPVGQPTDATKAQAREMLDKAWSQGQYATGVDQLMKEMEAAKASTRSVTKDIQTQVRERGQPEAAAPTLPVPGPDAITLLKSNPSMADAFNQRYGAGAAQKYLGAQ